MKTLGENTLLDMMGIVILAALVAAALTGCKEGDETFCEGDELLTGSEACESNDDAFQDRFDECCPDSHYDVDEECDEQDDSGEDGCIDADDVDSCNDDISDLDCPQDCDDVSNDGEGWHNVLLPSSCFYFYAD